jgi:hypothetical protein
MRFRGAGAFMRRRTFHANHNRCDACCERNHDRLAGDGSATNSQDEADKGVKTRNSSESGYVADQEKPGSSAHAPGRPGTAPPTQTTGEASRDPTVKEMNVKEKDKVERMGK